MSHSELNQLTKAEELFDAGNLEEALEILNDWSQFEELDSQQRGYYQFLKGLILLYQNKNEELIKLGEEIFKEGQRFNDNLQSVDGYFFISNGLAQAYKFNEALKIVEKAEALLRSISNVSKSILFQKETRISLIKAFINFSIGNMDLAEKCLEGPLNSGKELGNTFETVWANMEMARIMFLGKSKFDLALEYTEKALSLAEDIRFNHYWIAYCNISFGCVYYDIGEFEISLKHSMKSLAIFRKIKNYWFIAHLLNNIGANQNYVGDYNNAMKYFQESLLLFEKLSIDEDLPLGNLIEVALENDDIELAQKYYDRLENLQNQNKVGLIPSIYEYSTALFLKRSSRIRDKAKAEELLKQVIETETIWASLDAIIHLCDLLLAEYRISNSNEVLEEINHYVAKLLTKAEKSQSYLVFCEAFILQAKLALLNFNVKAARRFLTQAQRIAESYGIKRLAIKISLEHDELLKQTMMWKNLKESGASLSERWKLAVLSEQIENMVRKRMIALPKTSEENPVVILIIKEGGTPLFSHSFIEEQEFESSLFSGFLTTIDYFMKETFSEGLDRFIFGQYTLLMKSVPPFFVCYVFKGESYYALQRIQYFIEKVQKEGIWQNLIKLFQKNRSIHLKDIPLLESLITETFITKNVALNGS
jgi:tetratricopeptide (TPR) repeat protein